MPKLIHYFLVLLLTLISVSNKSMASHVMGADISYVCTGPNTYTFTMDIYRDCSGTSMSTISILSFTSPSGCGANFTASLTLVNTGGTEVSQVCPADLPNTNCNFGGTIPGTQIFTYTGTVTFPVGCTDWTYSYNLCCRNAQITNLTAPSSQNFFIDGLVNTTVCNNSPTYLSLPTPYICAGQPFCYSLGTSDTENDSLVFTLVQPLDGPAPGTPIPYVAGHTVNEPLTSSVPWTFNPQSGEFCFTPDVVQNGIVKIQVDEYRNGVLIGTSYRELQIIVQACTNIQPLFTSPPVSNLTGAVFADSTVIEVCPGDNINFNVGASDPNGDNITMLTNLGAFPGATFSTSCVCSPVTGTFNWTPTVADIGTHFLSVNIQDDGCPILGTQYLNITIIVLQGTLAGPDLFYCPAGSPVQINASGGSVFTWTPTTGLSCSVCPSPFASPTSTTTYIVTSDLSGTCINTDTVIVNVIPDFTLDAGPDVTICLNQFTQLNGTASPVDAYTWSWEPAGTLSDPNIANPIATPAGTTTYTATVTSSQGCILTDSVTVTISGTAPSISATANRDTVCPGDTTQLFTILPSVGCTDYTVSSIAYDPVSTGVWTPLILGDDQVSAALSIGFTFEFYCNPYTQFWVSSNGWMTFTSTVLSDLSPDAIPNTITPDNMIALAWADLSPNYGGTVSYKTIGAAPNRILILRYVGVNHCCSSITPTVTTQLKLFETTNTIEIHSQDVQSDGGAMTQGIENIDGTLGVPAPGRNLTVWTATNDAYRWELPTVGGPYNYTWVPAIGLDDPNIDNPIATVGSNTTYTVTVTDQANPSCTGTAQVSVGIYPLEVIATPDTTLCQGSTYVIPLDATVNASAPPACSPCGTNGTACVNPVTDKTLGSGTATNCTSCFPAPYGNFYNNAKHQFLFLESELTAAGVNCGTITELAWNVITMNTSTKTYKNFIIKMGCTNITALTTWQKSLSTVFTTKNVAVGLGWNAHPFDFTFDWDGVSNIIVEICFDNMPDVYTANASSTYTVTGFSSAIYYRNDVIAACPYTGVPSISSNRPNTRFSTCDGLAGSFTYSWTPTIGLSDPNIQDPVATVSSTTDYIVTVTGGVCDVTDTASVTFINCGCTPTTPSATTGNLACNGVATGSINLSVSGGNTPFTYAWSNGASTQDISSLLAGTYTVTITEGGGCDTIVSYDIIQPAALTGSIVPTNLDCNGICIGAGNLTHSGGIPSYNYAWSTGATTQDVSGLCAGSFSVSITDFLGCSVSIPLVITEPPVLAASIIGTDLLCNSVCDGAADLTVTGGTTPYTYAWSNSSASEDLTSLCAAAFTVTITDSKGCTVVSSITINQPTTVTASIVGTDESCNLACDGEANLTASGGTAPLTYAWSNLATSEDISSLCPALYTVTVTDANGCTAITSVTINPGANPLAGFSYNGNQCLTGNNYIFSNSGSSGGTYLWDFGDGMGTSTLENPSYTYTSAGPYTVSQTVTVGGCSAATTMNIIVNPDPAASIMGIDETCPGACDGSADLTPSGGTPGYNYSWGGGETSQDLSNLCAGTYDVTVTDLSGCQAFASVVIGVGPPPVAGFTASTDQCMSGNSFSFSNTGTTAMNGATFTWDFGDGMGTSTVENPTYSYTSCGVYTVTQTVILATCSVTASLSVEVFCEPTSSIVGVDPTCNGGTNGTATVTVVGGTGPMTYSWAPTGGSGATGTGLSGGVLYTVTVNDANGCTTTATITLTDPPLLTASITVSNDPSCNGVADGDATVAAGGGTGT
ncbi:MAG TPA: PKD domain-containing protein, partial [Flavobacteriales bacterium]|nr:PKD domain-containing protein [Flavobacteriales bacterium]